MIAYPEAQVSVVITRLGCRKDREEVGKLPSTFEFPGNIDIADIGRNIAGIAYGDLHGLMQTVVVPAVRFAAEFREFDIFGVNLMEDQSVAFELIIRSTRKNHHAIASNVLVGVDDLHFADDDSGSQSFWCRRLQSTRTP